MSERLALQRPQASRIADRKIVARLFPRSQRHGRAVAILTPVEAESARCAHTSRRPGLSFGLLAIWAALLPLVA
jgi:hypothetical protein